MELEEENQNYQNKSQIEEESEYDKSSKKSKKSRKEKINIETRNKEVEKKAQIGPIMTLAKPTTPPTST